MFDLKDLYQEMILDHNRQPRNFHKVPGANHNAEGYNPLCDDKIHVTLRMEGDKILDVGFEGSGCAISKASGSLMTTSVKGKTVAEVEALFEKFHEMVTGKNAGSLPAGLGKLEVFSGVSEFPARVKCASLAWHTLKSAIESPEGKSVQVTTEKED